MFLWPGSPFINLSCLAHRWVRRHGPGGQVCMAKSQSVLSCPLAPPPRSPDALALVPNLNCARSSSRRTSRLAPTMLRRCSSMQSSSSTAATTAWPPSCCRRTARCAPAGSATWRRCGGSWRRTSSCRCVHTSSCGRAISSSDRSAVCIEQACVLCVGQGGTRYPYAAASCMRHVAMPDLGTGCYRPSDRSGDVKATCMRHAAHATRHPP